MNKNWFEQTGHGILLLILVLGAYGTLMFGNGFVSMTHPNEAFYIQTAKEMVKHNSWLTPILFDGPQFEKPILFYLLSALLIKAFGLTYFIARFWPAFFGILGVCTVYWFSFILFKSKRQAFLSGLMLGTFMIHVAMSRAVLTDMTIATCTALSLGFFCLAYFYEEHRSRGLIGWCFFSALAVLTKGALGFSFTFTPVMLFLFYKKDWTVLKHSSRWIGFAIFALMVVPWHVLMYQQHGVWFIEEYWNNVHIRRIFESEHPKTNNWYFYLQVTFGGILPWSFFLIPAVKVIFKSIKEKIQDHGKLVFLLFWVFSVYLYTYPAQTKIASYILPVFPAIAMLLAYYVETALRWADEGRVPSELKACANVMVLFLIGVIVAGFISTRIYSDFVTNMVPIYITVAVVLVTLVSIFIFNFKKKYLYMLFSYVGVTIGLLTLLFSARPYIEPWVSCRDISEVFNKIDTSDTTVLTSKFYLRGIRFYTERDMAVIDINGKGFWSPHPIPFLNTDQKVIDFLDSQPFTYAVVKEGNVEDLERITKGKYTIQYFDGIGGKYILRIEKI